MQDYALGAFNLCPNLKLEKTPDTGSFFVGDQFNWTLHVTNSGAAATAVTVSDTIPASLQIIGTPSFDKNPGSGSDGTCGVVGQVVTCNVGALGANDGNAAAPENDTVDVTIKVKALASAIPAGTDAALRQRQQHRLGHRPGRGGELDGRQLRHRHGDRVSPGDDEEREHLAHPHLQLERRQECDADVEEHVQTGDTQAVDWPITVTNTGSTDVRGSEAHDHDHEPVVDDGDDQHGRRRDHRPDQRDGRLQRRRCGQRPAGDRAGEGGAVNGTLACTYSASLPDATTRTNTATATQQNYDYSSGSAVASGTTDYRIRLRSASRPRP